MAIGKPAAQICGRKFSLMFIKTEYDHPYHDSISINKLFITGYTKICYGYYHYGVVDLHLYQSQYGMNVELHNSKFYNMDQTVLNIQMSHANNSLLIKNCTFSNIRPTIGYINQIVYAEFSTNNATICLENCSFYHNDAMVLLEIQFDYFDDNRCVHPTNFTIENCTFNGNNGSLLTLFNHALECKANVFKKDVIIIRNTADLF